MWVVARTWWSCGKWKYIFSISYLPLHTTRPAKYWREKKNIFFVSIIPRSMPLAVRCTQYDSLIHVDCSEEKIISFEEKDFGFLSFIHRRNFAHTSSTGLARHTAHTWVFMWLFTFGKHHTIRLHIFGVCVACMWSALEWRRSVNCCECQQCKVLQYWHWLINCREAASTVREHTVQQSRLLRYNVALQRNSHRTEFPMWIKLEWITNLFSKLTQRSQSEQRKWVMWMWVWVCEFDLTLWNKFL